MVGQAQRDTYTGAKEAPEGEYVCCIDGDRVVAEGAQETWLEMTCDTLFSHEN